MLRHLVKILNPCLDPCRRIKQWWIKLPQWSTSNSIASSRGLEFLDKLISLGKPIQVNLHQLSIIPSKFLHTIKLNLNSSFWDKFFVQALYFHESLVISFRNWPNCSRKKLKPQFRNFIYSRFFYSSFLMSCASNWWNWIIIYNFFLKVILRL